MGYHPRIESAEYASFVTTRSRNSELWFINNKVLEETILGYVAKYAKRYGVTLYAFAIEGNHIHSPAEFRHLNRAAFMRDLNSSIARAVPRHTPEYPGGRFWGRRYSQEFVPGNEDIEEQFFYTVLQPVQDGLVEKISEYPGYNCFHDAVRGIKRTFKVVRWGAYNAAKRFNSQVRVKDYVEEVELSYERLPGYEGISQGEYARVMEEKLEARRAEIVKARYAKGLGFFGIKGLKLMKRGSVPRHTKTSDETSHRPRVLSVCHKRRAECREWYFDLYFVYKDCSERYRRREQGVDFPEGTYPPWLPIAA